MRFLLSTGMVVLLIGSLHAADNATPETTEERFSYLFAYSNIGTQINTMVDDLGLDKELLIQGLRDALEDKDPLVPVEEQQELYEAMRAKQQKAETAKGEANKQKGEEFMAEVREREGVVAMDSGLAYEVIEEGEGAKPEASDKVRVHYRGTTIGGEEFDSSYSRGEPAEFPLDGVIPGWTEGLQQMKTGAKYKLYVPSDLAYGERGSGGAIGPDETLIFEVELLDILPKEGEVQTEQE
ncbi:MAG: FKBP-type peptidyl-prolyl cis-trans isomerase [Planctomycetota bacterium]